MTTKRAFFCYLPLLSHNQPQHCKRQEEEEEANEGILQQLPIDQAAQAEGFQQMIAKKSVPLQPTQVDEKPPGQYHHPQHLDQLDLHKKELHHHQQRLSEPGRAHHEPPDVRQPRHHGGHPML